MLLLLQTVTAKNLKTVVPLFYFFPRHSGHFMKKMQLMTTVPHLENFTFEAGCANYLNSDVLFQSSEVLVDD